MVQGNVNRVAIDCPIKRERPGCLQVLPLSVLVRAQAEGKPKYCHPCFNLRGGKRLFVIPPGTNPDYRAYARRKHELAVGAAGRGRGPADANSKQVADLQQQLAELQVKLNVKEGGPSVDSNLSALAQAELDKVMHAIQSCIDLEAPVPPVLRDKQKAAEAKLRLASSQPLSLKALVGKKNAAAKLAEDCAKKHAACKQALLAAWDKLVSAEQGFKDAAAALDMGIKAEGYKGDEDMVDVPSPQAPSNLDEVLREEWLRAAAEMHAKQTAIQERAAAAEAALAATAPLTAGLPPTNPSPAVPDTSPGSEGPGASDAPPLQGDGRASSQVPGPGTATGDSPSYLSAATHGPCTEGQVAAEKARLTQLEQEATARSQQYTPGAAIRSVNEHRYDPMGTTETK